MIRWGLVAVSVLVLAGVGLSGVELRQLALELIELSQSAGPLGAALFGLGYVGSTVLLLPGSVLTLGAGYAWGPLWGVALVSPVSVAAATASFLLGRTFGRGWAERRLGKDPRIAAIDRAIGEDGFKLVLLLRLSPLFPFNLLNYALALTRVRLRDYVLASALGMFPATVLFVYLGSLASSGAQLLSGAPTAGPAGSVLYWAGLAATLLVVVVVTRSSRRALARVLAEPG